MSALLWWSGITMDTPIRDIGWTWVVLALLGLLFASLYWRFIASFFHR